MKTLNLTLKKKWFDMILSGKKKEEYLEIKEYWLRRLFVNTGELEDWEEVICDMRNPERFSDFEDLLDFFGLKRKGFDVILFSNGYSKTAASMIVECNGIYLSKGREELGAEKDKYYFVLKLGDIMETKNL